MIAIDFHPWIEQAAIQPGVLACGVKDTQSTTIKSVDAAFPEQRIKELMQALSEVGLTLRQDHLTGGRWRWVFENGQIHSARRPDGAFALLILTNGPMTASLADSVLAEFVATPTIEELSAETPEAVPDETTAEPVNTESQ